MTAMRKVHEGVADLGETYKLFQRHNDKSWEQKTAALYDGEFWETTEQAYWEFLEVLPPRQQDLDCFVMLEATTENIHSAFFNIHIDGESRYFHASIAITDRSSLSNAKSDIRDAMQAELEAGSSPAPSA